MLNGFSTSLFSFAFVSSITPGPNNIMLLSSGTNYGVRKTLPHLLGVAIGFAIMVVIIGLGLIHVFELFPLVKKILRIVCIAYVFYLSYKIAISSTKLESSNKKTKPFSFLQAVLFQWVNPKAWAMAMLAISIYAPDNNIYSVLYLAFVFALICIFSTFMWVLLGKQFQKLSLPSYQLRIFNIVMAFLLIYSVLF